jgi:hypothetical protein
VRIDAIHFEEGRTGWTLEEAHLDPFNLLVGPSGAGKTKIIRCLHRIHQVATKRISPKDPLDGERWTIRFSHEGNRYTWDLRSALLQPFEDDREPQEEGDLPPGRKSQIEFERITKNDRDVLVERGPERLVFEGKEAPQLTPTESVVALLTDPAIATIQGGFKLLLFSDATAAFGFLTFFLSRPRLADQLKRWKARYRTVEQLIEAAELPVQAKAFLLSDIDRERFDEIKGIFCDMFSFVEDIRVGLLSESDADRFFFGFEDALIFSLKERGTETWVPEMSMSSGMLRTLIHLFEVSLAPRGSVILIDEFENSLGVNCMPSLTEFILEHAPDHQFIITSHHPYIINQIPIDRWKLVRRRASRVRVVPARDIHTLQGASHLDAFTRLLNVPDDDSDAA